jgi:hypothetical protein
MTDRNPWIDPRVGEVRSAAAREYLIRRGWTPLEDNHPNFQEFEAPSHTDDAPIIRVPLLEQGRDYRQRIIELIGDLARAEGRPAVTVLEDLLASGGTGANGAPVTRTAEDASKTP